MIIPLLLKYPEQVIDFDAELLSGMEKAVVQAMKDIAKSGISPTETIIIRELERLEVSKHVIEWFIEEARKEPVVDLPYRTHELKEDYNTELYLKLIAYITEQVKSKAPSIEVLKGAQSILSRIKGGSVGLNVAEAARKAQERLDMIYSGRIPPTWKTGKDRLDEALCLGPKQVVMSSAQQKIGKTRFVA